MQDKVLVSATVITDDSTGCYAVGDLDFAVPGTTQDWLDSHAGNARKLAEWLRWLADRCEKREPPFTSWKRGETGDASKEGEK